MSQVATILEFRVARTSFFIKTHGEYLWQVSCLHHLLNDSAKQNYCYCLKSLYDVSKAIEECADTLGRKYGTSGIACLVTSVYIPVILNPESSLIHWSYWMLFAKQIQPIDKIVSIRYLNEETWIIQCWKPIIVKTQNTTNTRRNLHYSVTASCSWSMEEKRNRFPASQEYQ